MSSEEQEDEYDECMDDVRDMRRDVGEKNWEGVARCYLDASSDADVDECIDTWNLGSGGDDTGDTGDIAVVWPEEITLPEPDPHPEPEAGYPTGDLYYDSDVMREAVEWPYQEATWGEWRFKSVDGYMEIYNNIFSDGVRLQFVGSTNGWFYMKTGPNEFTVYSNLTTSTDSSFSSKGEVSRELDEVVERTYRYGNYLLQFDGMSNLYICHERNDWCLEYFETSNGWVTINSPQTTSPLTIFSSQEPATIDEWGSELR